MNESKTTRNKRKKMIVLLILAILILLTIMTTFAKYTGTIGENDGTAYVGTWNVTYDDSNKLMDHSFTKNLFDTVDGTKIIVPGVSGEFKINLVNKSDVAVIVDEIKLTETNTENVKIEYSIDDGATYAAGVAGLNGLLETYLADTTKATMGVGSTTETKIDIPVKWRWAFEVSEAQDAADTLAGTHSYESLTDNGTRAEYNVNVSIKTSQVLPE